MDIYQDNQLGEGVGAIETRTFRTRSGYADVPTNGVQRRSLCCSLRLCSLLFRNNGFFRRFQRILKLWTVTSNVKKERSNFPPMCCMKNKLC